MTSSRGILIRNDLTRGIGNGRSVLDRLAELDLEALFLSRSAWATSTSTTSPRGLKPRMIR